MRLDTKETLSTLAKSATYIDIAVVERISPDFEYGTRSMGKRDGFAATAAVLQAERREMADDGGARYHYRVLESLKARGVERFTINGMRIPPPPGSRRQREVSPNQLKFWLQRRDLADWEGTAICHMPVASEVGEKVLVFRDASGHLLQQDVQIEFEGAESAIQGPVYLPLATAHDPVVELVRKALSSPAG